MTSQAHTSFGSTIDKHYLSGDETG